MNWTIIKGKLMDLVLEYAPRVGVALAIVIIGPWIIKILIHMLRNILKKSSVDISLHHFIESLSEVLLKVVVFITAASVLGIETTTFIAILSAAGLAVGLAIKDSLSNFASGILILTFKPFGIGDFIKAEDELGTVKDIQLLYTHINTNRNKRIVIPNSDLANSKIINYSTEPLRRLDFVFGVSYDDDIRKVEKVLTKVAFRNEYVLNDPAPVIKLSNLGENSIDFTMKLWHKGDGKTYWNVFYGIHQEVKEAFDKEGITIPYTQRDIHLYHENEETELY